MNSRLNIGIIISCILIAALIIWICILNRRLDISGNDLEKKERLLEASQKEIEALEGRLSYYEQPGDGIKRHGQLRVENGRLVDSTGERVQLRGISSHGLTWFPRYTNAGALGFWKEAGANLFRAAMYSDQERGYIYYPEESSNYLYLAVENAIFHDMYAIIDWHILHDSNPLEHMEKAKEFFREAASHYRENPGIIYEICNEPNGAATWEDITEYANEIIPVIRTYAPEAVILIGMPKHSTDFRPVLEAPLPYENIMYTYHQYVDGTGEAYNDYNLKKMLEHKLPVFVSEWGIDLDTEDNVNFRASEEFLDMLEEEQISWAVWALSNRSGAHALIRPQSKGYGDFTPEDLNNIGLYIYNRLREQTPCILPQE